MTVNMNPTEQGQRPEPSHCQTETHRHQQPARNAPCDPRTKMTRTGEDESQALCQHQLGEKLTGISTRHPGTAASETTRGETEARKPTHISPWEAGTRHADVGCRLPDGRPTLPRSGAERGQRAAPASLVMASHLNCGVAPAPTLSQLSSRYCHVRSNFSFNAC